MYQYSPDRQTHSSSNGSNVTLFVSMAVFEDEPVLANMPLFATRVSTGPGFCLGPVPHRSRRLSEGGGGSLLLTHPQDTVAAFVVRSLRFSTVVLSLSWQTLCIIRLKTVTRLLGWGVGGRGQVPTVPAA